MLEVGSTFGRYRIERELGAGGMGYVYAAQDTVLRRSVALKIVRTDEDHAGVSNKDEVKSEGAARLLREARAAAALRHPNAVAVFDIGETDGIAFIAMELVTGRTLDTFIGSGGGTNAALSVEQKLHWLLGMSRALAAAHKEGIVHRDIKPENVMVTHDGSIKVLDFGIAKRQGAAPKINEMLGDGPASFKSKEGIVSGTPRYMSPEQLAGGTIDGRSDQFAWAIVAYELLSGVHPQLTTGSAQRWAAPPAPLSSTAPIISAAVSDVVMRSLERWPEHRWPSMDEVVRALEPLAGIVAHATPVIVDVAAASPTEPTMRFESPSVQLDRALATTEIPADVSGDEKRTGGSTAIPLVVPKKQNALLLPLITEVAVLDASRPGWRRLAFSALGLALMFAGLVVMLVVIVVAGETTTPILGKALIRVGWIIIMIEPLLRLARKPRRARVEASDARLAIRGARGMNQVLSPSLILGASAAPIGSAESTETTPFSVLLLPKRSGALPIAIDVANEDHAHSILAAVGITQSRALTGTLSWPLRRGAFDVFRFSMSIAWRIGIIASFAPIPTVSALGFAITVLAGLAALGLAFAPMTGPHLELTNDQIRIFDAGPPRVIALRDIEAATHTEGEIRIRLRSGDTLSLRAPTPIFTRRALSSDERAHLVDHVNAAAQRARVSWSGAT